MKRTIVTGANKGIGLAIVKRLLREHPDAFVYLGSRDIGRGEAAVQQIESELGSAAKERVKLLELDVTSDVSLQKAVAIVKADLTEANDQLYGLVNNAGGGGTNHRLVLELNTYGLCRTTEAFLPFIKSTGMYYFFELFLPIILDKKWYDIRYSFPEINLYCHT